jgi:exopolysaccharide biosynthesis polyprenyl glycosylphosphotransferase
LPGSIGPLPSLRHGFCAAVEFLLLVACFLAAVWIRFAGEPWLALGDYVGEGVLHALVVQVCLYYGDLYEDSSMRRRMELFIRIGQCIALATVVLALVFFLAPGFKIGRGILFIFLPLAFVALLVWRLFYFWAWGSEALSDTALILGTGPSAQHVAREVLRRPFLGFKIVGFLGEHAAEVGRRLVNPSVIGTKGEILDVVKDQSVSMIIVAMDDRRGKLPVSDLLQCRLAGIRVEEATNFLERVTGRILVRNLRPSWLVFSQGFNKPRLLMNSKRSAEFLIAATFAAIAAPVMALVALLVRIESRGPIFYRQERVGYQGRPFMLLKFRTMRVDAEAVTGPVWASRGADERMTRIGRILRKVRLDELPQLLNVLKGEMSFVGPRPERPHFVEQFKHRVPQYMLRHKVKAGMTGWAQVNGWRGNTALDKRIEYDLYYIENWSVRLDLKIIWLTILRGFFHKHAY